jgi:hypothetical protein
MRKVLLLLSAIIPFAMNSQIDSIKNNQVIPQRGIYLSYDEFVMNCPSIVTNFESTLIYRSVDTTVIGAQFKLLDSGRFLPPIWGFCDGTDAFIALYSKRTTKFWKLSFFGKNPYFLISHNATLYVGGPFLLGAIIGLLTEPTPYEVYQLMIIDKNGHVTDASYFHLKQLFAANPSLLKNFRSEKNISDKLKKQYLKNFNFQ